MPVHRSTLVSFYPPPLFMTDVVKDPERALRYTSFHILSMYYYVYPSPKYMAWKTLRLAQYQRGFQ